MSSRSIGRGVCPRCGREGVIVVKTLGGNEYVYVKHGRTWHYVGPLSSVNLNAILTTPIPPKRGVDRGLTMSTHLKGPGKGPSMRNILIAVAVVAAAVVITLIIMAMVHLPQSDPYAALNNLKHKLLHENLTLVFNEVIIQNMYNHVQKSNTTTEYGLNFPGGEFYVKNIIDNAYLSLYGFWINGSQLCNAFIYTAPPVNKMSKSCTSTENYTMSKKLLMLYAPFSALLIGNASVVTANYSISQLVNMHYFGKLNLSGEVAYCFLLTVNRTNTGSMQSQYTFVTNELLNETLCILGNGVPAFITAITVTQVMAPWAHPPTYNYTTIVDARLASYRPRYFNESLMTQLQGTNPT